METDFYTVLSVLHL